MKMSSYYPVLMTGDVAGTAAFYVEHFDFQPLFTSGWYVHLQSVDSKRVNLGIVQGDHETIPQEGRGRASGLLINFEVAVPTPPMHAPPPPDCRSCVPCATSPSANAISSPGTPMGC